MKNHNSVRPRVTDDELATCPETRLGHVNLVMSSVVRAGQVLETVAAGEDEIKDAVGAVKDDASSGILLANFMRLVHDYNFWRLLRGVKDCAKETYKLIHVLEKEDGRISAIFPFSIALFEKIKDFREAAGFVFDGKSQAELSRVWK